MNEITYENLKNEFSEMEIISVPEMNFAWLKETIQNKLSNTENCKVAFANSQILLDTYINASGNPENASMEDIDLMCSEAQYVVALIDQSGNSYNYDFYKSNHVEDKFKDFIRENEGMIVVGA